MLLGPPPNSKDIKPPPVVELELFHFYISGANRPIQTEQESVRPRWPYDMRPSVRAEKYGCPQRVPKSTCVSL